MICAPAITLYFFASTVDKYGHEEIAEAVSGTFTESDELTELQQILVNNLDFLLSINIKDEADQVKAYFECYNWVLNFGYKGKNRVYTLYIDYYALSTVG